MPLTKYSGQILVAYRFKKRSLLFSYTIVITSQHATALCSCNAYRRVSLHKEEIWNRSISISILLVQRRAVEVVCYTWYTSNKHCPGGIRHSIVQAQCTSLLLVITPRTVLLLLSSPCIGQSCTSRGAQSSPMAETSPHFIIMISMLRRNNFEEALFASCESFFRLQKTEFVFCTVVVKSSFLPEQF